MINDVFMTHYWVVANNEDQVWSPQIPGYVSTSSGEYLLWLANGGIPTYIASEEELNEVLQNVGLGAFSPNPPKRLVLKSVIVSRLIATGKIAAAKAALDANPAVFARWFASDRPAINFDDPDALALLAAIGADANVIMAE